jgi:hypothetical protein
MELVQGLPIEVAEVQRLMTPLGTARLGAAPSINL